MKEFVVIGCGVYTFTTTVCGFSICIGPSMEPTIDTKGELTFIDRFSYMFLNKPYKIDDVVISNSMNDENKSKRTFDYDSYDTC